MVIDHAQVPLIVVRAKKSPRSENWTWRQAPDGIDFSSAGKWSSSRRVERIRSSLRSEAPIVNSPVGNRGHSGDEHSIWFQRRPHNEAHCRLRRRGSFYPDLCAFVFVSARATLPMR
jgi:hypothetical protein